jgi:hypothetical protein
VAAVAGRQAHDQQPGPAARGGRLAGSRQAALRTSIYSRASIDRRSWIYSRSGRIFMNGTLASVSQLISRILPLGLLPGCLYCERCL